MKTIALCCIAAACLLSANANAALESRLGGLAVYDSDLNITWLADANANGMMNWSQAKTWAASLTVGGFSGWRLPNTLQPDTSCSGQWQCTGSEMGHLFYNELGGYEPNANHNLFQNFQGNAYWSGTEAVSGTAWTFNFGPLSYGAQGYGSQQNVYYALAVRPGDVASVPIPTSAWLLGSGLLGLIGVARRKTA